MAYASQCCPGGIGYAMSENPMGSWIYKGDIVPHSPRSRANHPGIIDYKGKSYVFSMNWDLYHFKSAKHAEQRSVVAAEFQYNQDGTIHKNPVFQDAKLEQIEPFCPYRKVEAETMNWGYGLKTMPKDDRDIGNPNQVVYDIDDGEYLKVKGVDFAKGAERFVVSALSHLYGGKIEIRVDSPHGKCLGNVTISNTQGEYKLFECKIKNVKGIHDLYFVFKGSEEQLHNLFVLDWWKFENKQ